MSKTASFADRSAWLTIVGLGEDGPDGLPPASLAALENAEIIMGAKRHLSLLPKLTAKLVTWPVPFADGVPVVMSYRGRRVVALASGDPFWHGAGAVLVKELQADEWRTLPAPSTMSLAAAALGWPLEKTPCFGFHAAPFERLHSSMFPGARMIATMRDGAAVQQLGAWLTEQGFGATTVHILEALGGPRERIRGCLATNIPSDIAHPVCVALEVTGQGAVMPLATGRPDTLFDNDGQITKRPVRALTLSALAPRPTEHLWDIGGGSGSIGLEWLMTHPTTKATAIEIDPSRASRIRANAAQLGLERLNVVTGAAPEALAGLPMPDAIFIGGGISAEMLDWIWENVPAGVRLVANGVTLEAEMLLADWHAAKGGTLLRIELSESKPLGRKRGWKASYPIVQWSVSL
ncbi:bifunctional cobalt-precorrin-7 (C(5))-methyltransferase/cobalt-precorrin-6B (C(15))-methyltransferase [Cognatishimia sp. WU-CL00825]|uniref:precorrin-6y C5,15-methyltransferase (decarboxylating) subunit CbiE n=1 Tax=Cognatishimia sp. WU-CL00825 TaxID=3127658 RepID=UPI003105CAE2